VCVFHANDAHLELILNMCHNYRAKLLRKIHPEFIDLLFSLQALLSSRLCSLFIEMKKDEKRKKKMLFASDP
jgi:hypothetical protein